MRHVSHASSRRTPGPITTDVRGYAALWPQRVANNQILWLWVPAFAGTTIGTSHGFVSRPASDWRRWSRRLGKDRADGPALQGDARALRHRRDHQRHLHQMGRGISGAVR